MCQSLKVVNTSLFGERVFTTVLRILRSSWIVHAALNPMTSDHIRKKQKRLKTEKRGEDADREGLAKTEAETRAMQQPAKEGLGHQSLEGQASKHSPRGPLEGALLDFWPAEL